MTLRETRLILIRMLVVLVLATLALSVVAAPGIGAAPAEFDRVAQESGVPEPPQEGDLDVQIAPVPGEDPVPGEFPVVTTPPKLAAESFGVGWTAAAAVGVAVLAVLGMALMWRREPS